MNKVTNKCDIESIMCGYLLRTYLFVHGILVLFFVLLICYFLFFLLVIGVCLHFTLHWIFVSKVLLHIHNIYRFSEDIIHSESKFFFKFKFPFTNQDSQGCVAPNILISLFWIHRYRKIQLTMILFHCIAVNGPVHMHSCDWLSVLIKRQRYLRAMNYLLTTGS